MKTGFRLLSVSFSFIFVHPVEIGCYCDGAVSKISYLTLVRPTIRNQYTCFFYYTFVQNLFVCSCLSFLSVPALPNASLCASGGQIGSSGSALYLAIVSAPRTAIPVSPATHLSMTHRLMTRLEWNQAKCPLSQVTRNWSLGKRRGSLI